MVNLTPSVPTGIYRYASKENASHITFCLADEHRAAKFYDHFCSPENPSGVKILKRIGSLNPNGTYDVIGDHPLSIDSRMIGPVTALQIQGFYQPLYMFRKVGRP